MSDDEERDGRGEKIAGEPEPPNFDGIEEQIDALHDNLDGIKEAGRNLQQAVEGEIDEDTEQEEVMEAQRLMVRANLLTRRVEEGDRNIVRGE